MPYSAVAVRPAYEHVAVPAASPQSIGTAGGGSCWGEVLLSFEGQRTVEAGTRSGSEVEECENRFVGLLYISESAGR